MKRRKVSRMRGSKTHGWGAMKKHRGAGNRGGRGNAGSGKRGDQRKPAYWNSKKPMRSGQKVGQDYFGKHGFASIHARSRPKAINVQMVDAMLDAWLGQSKITKSGKAYTVDLGQLGFSKLLGSGRISRHVMITVTAASARAIEKVSAAGGSVVVAAAAVASESAPDEPAEDS